MPANSDNSDDFAPYKDLEFTQFLEMIKEGQGAHWKEIAEALGVNQDTITAWKATPEAIEARREGISHALACMQQAGARDWKMWETRLKMFGINPATPIDVTSKGQQLKTALVQFVGDDGDEPDNNS